MERSWDVYEYVAGDNSLLILLYGVATIFLIAAYVVLVMSSVKSAYNVQSRLALGKHINTFVEDVKSLFNENLHKLLLTLRLGEYLYLPFCHLYL